jgi:iron complex outermembrane receptor protein
MLDTMNVESSGNTALRLVRLLPLVAVALTGVPSPALAQARPQDLTLMSLEDLMNIEITSASRKEQRAVNVAAAVFVITHEDIRRSGMTTVPDLLRLAPGVNVAHVNANEWAVSVRGFNGLYANKLLVLVDGHSIYNRFFSGVFWDAEDMVVDDIDRIEVIRGPGAASWGANAVNAVINIVTKAASDTQGGLVRVDAGRSGEQGAIRYGGSVGAAKYRLTAQWTDRNQSLIAPDTPANDGSHSVTTGFRADWTGPAAVFTLQGGFTAGQTRQLWQNLDPETSAREPIANDPSHTKDGRLAARWKRTRVKGASFQVQSFVGIVGRSEPFGTYQRRTFDIESQYHTAPGAKHDLVAGVGYRFVAEELVGRFGLSLIPPKSQSSLVTAFVQDEIKLFTNRLALTLGSQVQYDAVSGAGVQPTVRGMWTALPRQRVWAAVSRALRTPSLADRSLRLVYPPTPTASGLPLVVTVLGNAAAETETVLETEAGYRLQVGTTASIDVTGYIGRYDHLVTRERTTPIVQLVPSPQILVTAQFGNKLAATTRGLEVSGHWTPFPAWQMVGSFTGFRVSPHLAADSHDPAAAAEDASAPRRQWQLRSTFSAGSRATFGFSIFRVGPLEQLRVDAYTRADINGEWRFSDRLSVTAIGQNLFDAAHAEFAGASSQLRPTQVARSASLRLRWTFR